ncbi:hypothetical protein KKC17_03645 [Patescibacteria group bacterium]|nr:hypothetical protein [Patescibacteria group bacterium]
MNSFAPDSGFAQAFGQFKNKQEQEFSEISKYPFKNEVISVDDLKKLKDIQDSLNNLIKDYNHNAKLTGSGIQKESLCQQYIVSIEKFLDNQNIWKYKFSTDSLSGGGTEEPLNKSVLDSLYYMSESGISLRLKLVNFSKGLGQVVQPLMEKTVFESIDQLIQIKENPEVGCVVNDYASEEFYKALNESTENYKSVINIHQDKDFIKGLTFSGSIKHKHLGDRVNQVIFSH